MTKTLLDYSAVLFDFDGTLADSFDAIAASVNHVRSVRGHAALSVEDVKRHVGRGPEYLLTHTIQDCRLDEDLRCYRAHHPGVMLGRTQLLPGARALIEALHGAGKKIGLCSNKPRLFSQELLAHLGVAPYFCVVLGPEDVPAPKPAPDMLRAAVARLKLAPSQVLYVGDMTVDIATARAAEVRVWVVPTGTESSQTLQAAAPDRLLASLEEIVAEIARI